MRKLAFLVMMFLLAILLLIPSMYAQGSIDPVAALRQQFTGGDGSATLQIDGIHAATKVLLRPVDNRIVNGSIQSRGAMDILRGNDTILHSGEPVRVTKVETAADSKGDILRISVVTGNNALAQLAFVVPKSSLSAMSQTQLNQLVSPVLRSANANPEQPPANRSQQRTQATRPPAPPPHPDRTVVDLPPAASGYPPLHASAPAMEGCWWTPFLSEKYSLEMLVQKCAPGSGFGGETDTFLETATGIGVRAGSNPETEELMQVLNKPASQSASAAIKQQFILKQKDPAVRANCIAKLQSKNTDTTETYSVVPTGVYAKLKKFNKGEDSEDPCPGLGSDDNVGRSYIYIPNETKTKFIYYFSQEAWPLDISSIHFLPASDSTNGTVASNAGPPVATTANTPRSPEPTGDTPRRGLWINVGKLYPHDSSGDAATAGQFNLNAENTFEPATIFIACDGRVPTNPKLVLRMAVPLFQGFQASQAGRTGTLMISNHKREAPFESVAVGKLIFLEIELSPIEITLFAFSDETEVNGLGFLFSPNLLRSTVTADLPPSTPTLDAAIQACHVKLPPRPATVAAAVSPSQVQRLELAKIALGMTSDQVRSALGTGFQFVPQSDPGSPRLSYLAAVDSDAAYSVTMIDGQVQGFNYAQRFALEAQPLQSNLIAGVTAKAWQPIFVRPPYRAIWVTNEQGKPITKPLPDIVISPCAGINDQDFGPLNNVNSTLARSLRRVLPRDNGSTCGVTINMSMVPSHRDSAMAESLSLSVANDVAFHAFMLGINQGQQQRVLEQRKKADEVKSPF